MPSAQPTSSSVASAPACPSSGAPDEIALWGELLKAWDDPRIVPSVSAQHLLRTVVFQEFLPTKVLALDRGKSSEIVQVLNGHGGSPNPVAAWRLLKAWALDHEMNADFLRSRASTDVSTSTAQGPASIDQYKVAPAPRRSSSKPPRYPYYRGRIVSRYSSMRWGDIRAILKDKNILGPFLDQMWKQQEASPLSVRPHNSILVIRKHNDDAAKGDEARLYNLRLFAEFRKGKFNQNYARLHFRGDALYHVGGSGSRQLGWDWLSGQGVGPLNAVERSFMMSLWGPTNQPTEEFGTEIATLRDFAKYMRDLGPDQMMRRLIQLRHVVDPALPGEGESEVKSWVLVVRTKAMESPKGDQVLIGPKLYTPEEFEKIEEHLSHSAAQLHIMHVQGSDLDAFVLGKRKGGNAADLAEVWRESGGAEEEKYVVRNGKNGKTPQGSGAGSGLVFAPGSAHAEDVAKETAKVGIRTFVPTSPLPESQQTPVQSMDPQEFQLPGLAADVLEMAKPFGFPLGVADWKRFAIPPSEGRLHAPGARDNDFSKIPLDSKTLCILAIAGLLIVVDGPLPFGDAAAAVLVGGRLLTH